jgi:ubiquinone/menaquinone biosynthesis C-methylase UbiE
MSRSRSFDRAASYYDQTRPFLEPIAQAGVQAILDLVGWEARVLDVGTGTGRISIPLLERGLDLIGCDLSAKMLRRLQEKSPSARIAQADASQLPFPTGSFDAVMTAHILHLIPMWREALREFRRVLRPQGVYLNLKTWEVTGVSIRAQMRETWREWLDTQGVDARLPGVQGNAEFLEELRSMGVHLSAVEVIRYPLVYTLREELERFASRIYSDSWEVPDDVFDASLKELRAWAEADYGDLDQPHEDEVRFTIDIARFVIE